LAEDSGKIVLGESTIQRSVIINPMGTMDIIELLSKTEDKTIQYIAHQFGITPDRYSLQFMRKILARKLSNNTYSDEESSTLDITLRQPLMYMELPLEDGPSIVCAAMHSIKPELADYAKEYYTLLTSEFLSVEAQERREELQGMMTMPITIPDCYGFHESVDEACQHCPYSGTCEVFKTEILPPCFELLHREGAKACSVCLYAPWCGSRLLV